MEERSIIVVVVVVVVVVVCCLIVAIRLWMRRLGQRLCPRKKQPESSCDVITLSMRSG